MTTPNSRMHVLIYAAVRQLTRLLGKAYRSCWGTEYRSYWGAVYRSWRNLRELLGTTYRSCWTQS
jgi:hypothetical protein